MTALAELFKARIARTGPMSVAEYMAECLLHPQHGYYTTRDPLGVAGDFTTAPEISQMFGELIGLALAQVWLDRGAPAPFILAELGPGRGTLMADILRATRSVPGFHAGAQLHLVEASPALRAAQNARLAHHAPRWCDRAADLPEAPLFLVANEFFDALPVHQYVRDGTAWRERKVGLEGGQLVFGQGNPLPMRGLEPKSAVLPDGALVETCPAAEAIIAEIAARIATHDGAALIIDYGDWGSRGDTFQAVRGHEPENVLANPGEADLTAHVDFAALARAARGLIHSPLTPQGVFLERLGITARAQALATQLTGDALENHIAAHRRLTHPDEMGRLFKVMGLFRPATPPLPGLAET
jgi:NADH dehydrogenase [ubiquinone] 1 alpha subcomplex assembly factor 7